MLYTSGIVDRPDDWLKPHEKPIPYLGGVAVFLGWVAGLAAAFLLFQKGTLETPATNSAPSIDASIILGIVLAGAAIMLIGLLDDIRPLPPKVRLAGNVIVAVVLMCFGIGSDVILVITNQVDAQLSPWMVVAYSAPITIFVVVGACNATNLIDGVDGLCSGVFAVISTGFLILAVHMHLWSNWHPLDVQRVVLIALALLGASLGFLPFNRNPAKIFMGDAGSMLLGLNAAIILLLFAKQGSLRWAMGALVVFTLPIADMSLTLVRRWRNEKPIMVGDRSHFYDQLLDRGMPVKRVVRISYLLAAVYSVAGCLVIFLRIRYAVLLYLFICAATLWAIKKAKMVKVEPPRPRKPSGKPLKLLFTSAGRRVSLINEFRRAADDLDINLEIHAADFQAMAPALQVADRHLLVPSVLANDYCDVLIQYCRENDIDGLIPLIDPELIPLASAKEKFLEVGTRVLISSPKVVDICVHKDISSRFLLENNFLTPRILTESELANPKFPLFMKPRIGSSSKGTYKINDSADLQYYLSKNPESIVQEYIEGVEYTVDVFADFDGRPRCAVPRRRLRSTGRRSI